MKRQFRRIDPSTVRVILLDAGERVVSAFSEQALREGRGAAGRARVTVREGARATEIDERGVTIEVDGATERIEARTVIWAAGVHAVPFVDALARPPARAPTAAGGSRSTRT